MAFTTLAERFEASSKDIYGRFAPQTPNSNQPFVSVKPDTEAARSRIKDDIRLFPVGVSVNRDYTRISKFLTSGDGALFIAKQYVLQSANTFANTKIYNPASPLLNTVPGVHAKRFISTDTFVQRTNGLLQNSTLATFSPATISQAASGISSITNIVPTLVDLARGEVTRRARAQFASFTNQVYNSSRPEFVVFGDPATTYNPRVVAPMHVSTRSSKALPAVLSLNNITQKVVQKVGRQLAINARSLTSINRIRATFSGRNIRRNFSLAKTGLRNIGKSFSLSNIIQSAIPAIQQPTPTSFIEAAVAFRAKQLQNTTDRLNTPYFGGNRLSDWSSQPNTNVSYNNGQPVIGEGTLNNIYDTLNKRQSRNLVSNVIDRLNYGSIEDSSETDIVKFAFTSLDNTSVQFRALISNIKEQVKPEYNEQRYIGRTERFVTYAGVRRSVAMNFNIVAFSKGELDDMWTRINYLTGLAFPRGVSDSGFVVPPLFKLTVGQIYDLQPCYIDTLDFDLLDNTITFDVDKQVSQVINVSMNLTILEKRSKFYNSPFYKITENIQADQAKTNNPVLPPQDVAVETIRNLLGRL